jgi:carboxypeptidase T
MRKRRLLVPITFVTLLLLVTPAAALPAEPDAGVPQPPQAYRVILPAADVEERTALAAQGVAIDGLSGENVVSIMTAEELAAARRAGIAPLSVTPLDFPPADAAYHNYAELLAALAETAAAYPHIVQVTSAGTSLEDRDIPAVKISDHPEISEPDEPAILFIALHHAREHLTVEMALAIIRLFTEGYGSDAALTNLVEQREIWVLPNVNPDGGEFDIETGSYLYWRKNRRPNGDGSYGVDLNRNYGYRWACCYGSSPDPWSDLYHGTAPFSEPETRAVRDFVVARPNITAAISFHTYGELILYPYGYTYADLPEDMQPDDYRAFVALAADMAATNGYSPQQASDLYVTAGDTVDWLYGERRIFAFTFEMYPTSWTPGFYPPGDRIPRETARNIAAVTYLTGMADNPRKTIGLGGDASPPQVSLATTLLPDRQILLAAEAEDDIGVTLVAWQIDGVTVALDRTAPYTTTWTAPAAGRYDVVALAFDAGGNTGEAHGVIMVAGETSRTYLPLLHR